jgi:GT2 family glycosyltransferase
MTLRAAEASRVAMRALDGAITIIDNDSQDGSFEYLTQHTADWPDVRVIQAGQNGGFGAGNNLGIRAGLPDGRKPDFVYLQNPDAFPDPDAIRILMAHMRDHPTCGFVGSGIHGEDGVPHMAAFRFPSILSEIDSGAHTGVISRLLRNHRVTYDLPTTVCAVDWCSGASVMFRQATLDQVGLFDETFFLYFEETDLCRRVWNAGWVGAYVPQANTMHIGSVSTGMGRWKRVPQYWFDSRAHYFRKHHGGLYLGLVTAAYLAAAGFWKLRRVIERKEERIPPYFLRDLVDHTIHVLKPSAMATRAQTGAGKLP